VPREFTPEEQDAIVDRYVDGTSVNMLRTEYQVDWTQIAKILKARGVFEGRRRQQHLDKEVEMVRRHQAGESLAQIADHFNCTPSRVCVILKRLGVEGRPAGTAVPDYVPRVRELRAQGLGARRIAKELGIGITTANKWMVRFAGDLQPREAHQPRTMGGYRNVWLPVDDPFRSMAWKRGYVPEHRLVMARSLGRPLARNETVHHINGDTLDNRIENLQLRKGQHGKGVVMSCLDCGSHNVAAIPLT
jgi:Mor family transcriptional regulator